MMDAYQVSPNGQISYGYKPLPDGGPAATALGQGFIVAAIGVALGIVFGTVFAASPWVSNSQDATPDVAQISYTAASSTSHPASSTVQTSSPQSQAVSPANTTASAPLATPVVKTSATPISSPVNKHRALRTALASRKSSRGHKASFHRALHASPVEPQAVSASPASQAAKADVPAASFTFMIEGDVTVADFDASAGRLETNEGKIFAIGQSAGAGSASQWDDSPSNVHYRCTQTGSCTLVHAGVVFLNARLTT